MRLNAAILLALTLLCPTAPAADDQFHLSVVTTGAIAGDGKDDTPAFQLAHDMLAVRGSVLRAKSPSARNTYTVTIPAAADPYEIKGTIWSDAPFIKWQGEGEGSCLQSPNMGGHPIFLFGLRRQTPPGPGIPKLLVADAIYRPDLFGRLDATAASAPRQRWGFRSNGDSFIQSQTTPLDAGGRGQFGTADNWLGVRTLTIEVAVAAPDGGKFPAGVPIACMGDPGSSDIGPFTLHSGDINAFVFQFSTQAKPFGPKVRRRLDFSTGAATGVQRLAIQLDFASGQATAFGPTEPRGPARQIASTAIPPGLSLAENDIYPLLIGDGGGARPALGNVGGHDALWLGYCESRTPRYRTDGSGTVQRRADKPGVAITDRYRYFTPRDSGDPDYDAGTIGYLEFTDDPASLGRRMTVRHGAAAEGWATSSAFLVQSLLTVPGGVTMNGVSDLRIVGGGHYGQAIAIGQVIDFKADRCRIENAYHAIGALSNGAAYMVDITDCYLQGSDAGIFGNSWICNVRNTRFPSAGRATIRGVGCNLNLSDIFVGQWSASNQATLISHGGDYGGTTVWRGGQVDYEGPGYQRAAVVVELAPYLPATVRLQDLWFGTMGGVPAVELSGVGPAWFPPGRLMLSNISPDGGTVPVVATSARWSIDGAFTPKPIAPVVLDPNEPVRPALPR